MKIAVITKTEDYYKVCHSEWDLIIVSEEIKLTQKLKDYLLTRLRRNSPEAQIIIGKVYP